MISENATTLYVRSAISAIIVADGPHGSFDVASRTFICNCMTKVRFIGSPDTRFILPEHLSSYELDS